MASDEFGPYLTGGRRDPRFLAAYVAAEAEDESLTERLMGPSERHRHRAVPAQRPGVEFSPPTRTVVHVAAILGLLAIAVTLWWLAAYWGAPR